MDTFKTTQGDTELVLETNMDLTGSTLTTKVRPSGTALAVTTLTTTVVPGQPTRLAIATAALAEGRYDGQVKIIQGGKKSTAPDDGRFILIVGPSLG